MESVPGMAVEVVLTGVQMPRMNAITKTADPKLPPRAA
jgi:hypothetical protein